LKPPIVLHPDLTVAEVSEQFPETLPVFTRRGMDLCCGGRHSLAFVAQAHKLDLEELMEELRRSLG